MSSAGSTWVALLALALAGEARAESGTPGPSAAEAFRAGDCALCHQVPGQPEADRSVSCTGCHTWIRAVADDPARRSRAVEIFPLWERYEANTHSFLEVPSLQAAMARLDPAWVVTYLADPHDLRPGLPETMPRFGLDEAQRTAIATAFAQAHVQVPATAAPDPARVEAGAQVFADRGCAGCHAFGAVHPVAGAPQAPDLAHARSRMDPDMLAAWIADPRAISDQATMPALGLTGEEVLAVRDFLLLTDPGWRPADAPRAEVVPVERAVGWDEVESRVFGRICVHCHMDPAQNDGRAGPGNAGGFGYAPTGIALQTREQVMAVADRIPEVLRIRRHEAARDVLSPGAKPKVLTRSAKPGMPLGLPPLSDEDLALVLGWIAQGSPP